MFRHIVRNSTSLTPSFLLTSSSLPTSSASKFVVSSSASSATPVLFTSTSRITTSYLISSLSKYQSEFAVSKNPILKREAADLIEKEVLSDISNNKSSSNNKRNENESDAKVDDVDGEEIISEETIARSASALLAPPPNLDAESVCTILVSAATFGVNLLEPCHAVGAALRWCLELPRMEEEENSARYSSQQQQSQEKDRVFLMDAPTSAKVLQSLIGMQHPHVMEILVAWVHRIKDLLPFAEAPAVVSLAHAYGRTGTVHQGLLSALEQRAMVVLSDTQLIAQVANSFYAFAQMQSKNEELYRLLASRALDLLPQASPIVITTIIDSIATSGVPQPELLEFYEKLAAAKMDEATPPLVSSLMFGVVRCHNPDRTEAGARLAAESPVVTAAIARIPFIADSFDAASGSKLLQALVIANIIDENILTQVADRITSIATTCKLEECATILRSIAQFELYDDQLFEALARRTMNLVRGSSNLRGSRAHQGSDTSASAEQVCSILCSFAMVSQPHGDLFSACTNVIKFRANQLTSPELIDLMWAYVVLGEHLRHEPIFVGMQNELKRREALANQVEKDMIKKHPRYETAMQVIAQ